jgi:hypothetical protein
MIVPANGGPPIGSFVVLNTPTQIIQSPFPQIELFDFTPNQGSAIVNSFDFTPNQGNAIVNSFDFTPNQGSTTITNFIFFPIQYDDSNKIELFTFQPAYETIQIKTARYTADRLLATTLPKVKHGSTEINKPFQPDIDQGSVDLPYDIFQPDKGVDFEPGILFTTINKDKQVAQRDLLVKGETAEESNIEIVQSFLNTRYTGFSTNPKNSFRVFNLGFLKEARDNVDSGNSYKDFREYLGPDSDTTNPRKFNIKFIDGIEPTIFTDNNGNIEERNNWETTGKSDLIDFKIKSLRDGNEV